MQLDNLDRDVREARRLGYGCHYGRYKADRPHTRELPPEEPVEAAAGTVPEWELSRCRNCGKPFRSNKSTRLYCSPQCRKLRKAAQDLQYSRRRAEQRRLAREHVTTCGFCGEEFCAEKASQVYCSRSCAAKATGLRKRNAAK